MADGMTAPEAAALYDQDFHAWTRQQAEALRAAAAGRPTGLDFEHLAEEIESLGKREHSELGSRIATIIEHLVKLEHSPARDPRPGWAATVRRERRDIERLLRRNPSLRREVPAVVKEEAPAAVRLAAHELMDRGEIDKAVLAKLTGADYDSERVLENWLPGPLDDVGRSPPLPKARQQPSRPVKRS